MTPQELLKIESTFDIILPDYYRNTLLNYPDTLMESGGPEFELISYAEKLITENTQAYVELWGKPLSRSYFVVGENGCGDYFIIDLRTDVGVLAYEHETDSFYSLSNNLEEYIEGILNDNYEQNFGKKQFQVADLRLAR